MSNFETQRDYLRLEPNFRKSLIQEVLPEYFQTSYPSLISFLEGYYEWLDSDDNFGGAINELRTVRDLQDTTLERLDFAFNELALGISQSQFTFPREALRNFGNFFRVKGSLYSADGFFRAFFNEDIEVIYPKKRILRVGLNPIGPESAYVMTDGRLYQIFSVLIKSPIPLSVWEQLYRRFVHPSGFYLGAQTVLEGQGQVTVSTAESIFDPFANVTKIYTSASVSFGGEGETTILLPDDPLELGGDLDQAPQRMDPNRTIDYYGTSNSMSYFETWYSNLDEWGGYAKRGITMDDSADINGSAVSFDNTYSTMDARQFKGYSQPYNLFVKAGYVQSGYNVGNHQINI